MKTPFRHPDHTHAMNFLRFNPAFFILVSALFTAVPGAAQDPADTATIETILVEASNSGEGIDESLESYAPTLRRLFKFDSYRRVDRNRFEIDLPGTEDESIGHGSRLSINARRADNNTLLADLAWSEKGRTLLHTRLNLRRGTPAVLGGPRSTSGAGNYLLIVVWR